METDLQCAAVGDPSELILIEEVAVGIFFECDGREAGRKSAIVVLSYVRDDGDSRCDLVDVAVRERDAHSTGPDVARRTA